MKKKKSQSEVIVTVLLILIALASIVLIANFLVDMIRYGQQPEYKIYKNECNNITNIKNTELRIEGQSKLDGKLELPFINIKNVTLINPDYCKKLDYEQLINNATDFNDLKKKIKETPIFNKNKVYFAENKSAIINDNLCDVLVNFSYNDTAITPGEKCEQVKVDKIEDKGNIYILDSTKKIRKVDAILPEEINDFFLANNCECTLYCENKECHPSNMLVDGTIIFKGKCSQYQCRNYEVIKKQ